MSTAQQQADYWAWQVEIGRGQWESRLCMRGLGDMGLIGEGRAAEILA